MGFYNGIQFKNKKGEDCEIQVKCMSDYDRVYPEIGDDVKVDDGIYFGFEGCFVVWQGKIVAAFDGEENNLFSKWGHILPFPDLNDINPLLAAIKKLSSDKNVQGCDTTGMKWVKVGDRLPEIRPKAYFVKYGSADSHGTLHVDYFAKWGVTVWLDEEADKTISEQNVQVSDTTGDAQGTKAG